MTKYINLSLAIARFIVNANSEDMNIIALNENWDCMIPAPLIIIKLASMCKRPCSFQARFARTDLTMQRRSAWTNTTYIRYEQFKFKAALSVVGNLPRFRNYLLADKLMLTRVKNSTAALDNNNSQQVSVTQVNKKILINFSYNILQSTIVWQHQIFFTSGLLQDCLRLITFYI